MVRCYGENVSEFTSLSSTTIYVSCLGFYFMLNGKILRNNSNLNLEDVGENDGGLLCVSEDNPFCCDRVGEFYYPNNTKVPVNKFGHDLWRNRGDSFIRLNRRITASLPAYGTYRCEIPYSQNFHENIYFTIGEFYYHRSFDFNCVILLFFLLLFSIKHSIWKCTR